MLTPLEPKQWDFQKAAHLLNRAGFGGTPEDIAVLEKAGLDAAVKQMLNPPDDGTQFPKPAWAVPRDRTELFRKNRTLSAEERKARLRMEQKTQREHTLDLVGWWLQRMRQTPAPLREKMTLFWHGHFATSVQKVKDTYLMWLQNETLRQNALGNFGALTKAISRDPAMMLYLDTQQSNRGHPNENFARELMELFTLGIGNYSEDDIQESARAFTGYKIDRRDESFRFLPVMHDDGEKKFFGHTGRFGGDDIIGMILEKPVCAKFIAKKLWEFFVYEDPAAEVLNPLAEGFFKNKYALRPLMEEIFRSAGFYSPKAIRTQIKSPVQWLVGSAKMLEVGVPGGIAAANALRQLGQILFAPPSVKGWDGGKSWITTSTLYTRYNLANYVVGNGPFAMQPMRNIVKVNPKAPERAVENQAALDLEKIAPAALRKNSAALVEKLAIRLFQEPAGAKEKENFGRFLTDKNGDTSDQTIRALLHLMMSTPQFQLT